MNEREMTTPLKFIEEMRKETHLKQYKDQVKKWRLEHPEKVREYARKYYQTHKEYYREYMRKYYGIHKETWDDSNKKHMRQTRFEVRIQLLNFLGGKCVRCGFSDWRALQIDHIHGGGTKETKKSGNSPKYLKKVLADTEGNYQLLCANCNQIKKYENNEVKNHTHNLINYEGFSVPKTDIKQLGSVSKNEQIPYEQ